MLIVSLFLSLIMGRAWLIDCRGLAKKVKNADLPAEHQIKDCGANRHCPNCQYLVNNSDMSHDWPGFPAGVKFSPSDVELLDHLEAKRGSGDFKPHVFIDEFIPTLEGFEGICYTHPENLPGAKKDGSSVYFFYTITNAYSCGSRKRRRIVDQETVVRWHKTGKTKEVMDNGVLKGYKKIMVLYATTKGGSRSKPDKCNWVMHQYHLGNSEDETEGEYVVSEIFYQRKKKIEKTTEAIPRTPQIKTPDPPSMVHTPYSGCSVHDYFLQSFLKKTEHLENEIEYTSCFKFDDERTNTASVYQDEDVNQREEGNDLCGISDLYNLELDTPPDFQLNDLQFASQDSVFDWADRF